MGIILPIYILKMLTQSFALTCSAIGAILELFTTETGSNNTGTPDSYATETNNTI